jgi:hypothetical protein
LIFGNTVTGISSCFAFQPSQQLTFLVTAHMRVYPKISGMSR